MCLEWRGGEEEAKGHISHFSICPATERAAQSLTSFSFQTHWEGGEKTRRERKYLSRAPNSLFFFRRRWKKKGKEHLVITRMGANSKALLSLSSTHSRMHKFDFQRPAVSSVPPPRTLNSVATKHKRIAAAATFPVSFCGDHKVAKEEGEEGTE